MVKARGEMLGTVARNPLLRLNGSGQKRMPVRYHMPSLRRTWPRAMNLLSWPTMRSTALLRTVLLAIKATRLPAVHAAAAIGHPPGNPYTKPLIVVAVEYPMTGGNAVTNTSAKAMSHPPGRARHEADTVASQSNSRRENMKPSMMSAYSARIARPASTRCRGVIRRYARVQYEFHAWRAARAWRRREREGADDVAEDRERMRALERRRVDVEVRWSSSSGLESGGGVGEGERAGETARACAVDW